MKDVISAAAVSLGSHRARTRPVQYMAAWPDDGRRDKLIREVERRMTSVQHRRRPTDATKVAADRAAAAKRRPQLCRRARCIDAWSPRPPAGCRTSRRPNAVVENCHCTGGRRVRRSQPRGSKPATRQPRRSLRPRRPREAGRSPPNQPSQPSRPSTERAESAELADHRRVVVRRLLRAVRRRRRGRTP